MNYQPFFGMNILVSDELISSSSTVFFMVLGFLIGLLLPPLYRMLVEHYSKQIF